MNFLDNEGAQFCCISLYKRNVSEIFCVFIKLSENCYYILTLYIAVSPFKEYDEIYMYWLKPL